MEEPTNGKKFLGLQGLWGQIANLGIAGVVCFVMAYLVMFQIPDLQHNFHAELAAERATFREELNATRGMFREELRNMSSADKELARSIDALTYEIRKASKKENEP